MLEPDQVMEEIRELRQQAQERIFGLLTGTNVEDDNIVNILDETLYDAFIQGAQTGMVVINSLTDLANAIQEGILVEQKETKA